jgi:prolyl 4-hydroxylase
MAAIEGALRRWIRDRAADGQRFDALVSALVERGHTSDFAQAAVVHVLFDEPEPGSMPEPLPSGPVTAIETSDRSVSVLATMESPRIVVLGGILSPDECEALIALSRARMAPSRVVDRATGNSVPDARRTSSGAHLQGVADPLIGRVDRRLAELVNWPPERCESMQVLRYGPGQEYRPHWDYFDPADSGSAPHLALGGNRIGTLIVYLATPAEGGASAFPDVGLEVAPVQGNGVFFRYPIPDPESRTLHGARPVIRGEKWIATKWLRQRAIPGPSP